MPGAEYELQRLGDAGFTPDAPWEWVPLLSLQATGLVSSAIDRVPTNVQQRFYRVALLGPGTNDTQAPLVEFEGGEILNGPDQSTRLTLTFLATDDTGVESVTVLEGTNVLGEATTTNGSEWVFIVPADLQAPQTRYFSAKARDGSGKVGQSDPVGLLTLNPDMFAPVGSIGEVLERQALVVTGGNHIAEFIFRPGGRPRPGYAPDFYLRFPDGATRANTTGSVVTVEFVRVVGEFDPESPFRLDAPLVRDAGPTLQLPLGPLGFTNLVTLFGLDPTNGVPLTVFDQFRLRWRGGTLDDRGLVGAQFHSEMRDLPLPDWSAGFANYLVDFSRERVLRVPFTGNFALPDKLKYPAWVGIPPGRPMWLALRSDGAVKIEGPVELMLSTNLNIRAQLRFDDPVYDLTLSPPALRYAGLTNLAPVLPSDPGQCHVLGAPTAEWNCLKTLRRAYGSFAAAVSDCATSAPPTELPMPDYIIPAADVLEAWSYNALSRGSHSQPYDYVEALVAQAGIQAGASPELLEVMAIRVALLRSYQAMRAINAPSSSREVVTNALWQAETAAADRADDVAAGLRLDTMVRVARLAAEADDLRRINELPNTPFDTTTLPQMFIDLAHQLAAAWDVSPGVFEPDNNPTINSLDRHAAMAALRQVVEFRQHANTLAIPLNTTPIAELSGQLGVRAVHAVEAAMNQADFAEEFPAFALAAREYLELSQWMADGLLPDIPALVWLKNGSRLGQLQTRLARLFELNMQRSARPSSLGRSAADLRVFLAVERSLNFTNTLDKSLLQKLHERLATNLVSKPALSESNLVHLLERLETGNLNDELARKFQLPRFEDWTDIVMPTLVTQMCVVAKPLRAWRELDAATELMLEAADHNRTPLGPSGTYLSPAADLLRAARDVARGLMNDSANSLRREDFVLPGDAELYDPAGYVFYNRLSGQLHGAVRGRLRLPTFGLDLTVPNASIDSGGAFDLSAFGSLNFDGGILRVPERLPLHLRHSPERGLSFAGGTQLNLDNGLQFGAAVALTDPIYQFAISARGIEFNLGRELMLQRPALGEAGIKLFKDEARDALADYLRALNGSVETLLTTLGDFEPVDPNGLGRPPEFAAPELVLDFSTINAWSADVLTRAQGGLNQASENMIVPLREAVQRLNEEARVARDAVVDERARIAHLAARIHARRQVKKAVNAMTNPGADFDALLRDAEAGLRADASNVAAMVTADLPNRLPDVMEVLRLLTDTEAAFQDFSLTEDEPTLPSDPCQAMLDPRASLAQRAEALTACAATTQALGLGIDPTSGAIVDSNKFNSLSADQIEQAQTVMFEMEALAQARGTTNVTVLPTIEPLVRRHRELTQQELATTTDMARQFELMWSLLDNAAWSQSADVLTELGDLENVQTNLLGTLDTIYGDVLSTPGKGTRILRAQDKARKARENQKRRNASAVNHALGRDRRTQIKWPDADYTPHFFTQLAEFIRLLRKHGGAIASGSLTNVDAFVRNWAADLRARPFTAEFLTNRMNEAEATLNGIIGLTDWAGQFLTNDTVTITNLQFALTNLTITFNSIAEAQKAWWLVDRYQETLRRHAADYGTNSVAALDKTLRDVRASTLYTGRRINDALNTLLGQVQFKDVLVTLPGEVEVRYVNGRLYYDRQRQFMEGCFGGRLEFPQVNTNMFFEIKQACLASDGSFSLISTNATPIPLGGVRVALGMNVQGSPAGIATFQGAGTLWVPNGAAGDRVFSLAANYDQQAHRIGMEAQGQNLSLPFGQDFVLFDAGFGFDVSTALPNGQFHASGSAGLIARDHSHPLPPNPGPGDFHLVVTNLNTTFIYSNNLYIAQLDNGKLLLPEFFRVSTNGLCASGGNQPPPGPVIALSSTNPVRLRIEMGDFPRASFSGGLDVSKVGFQVPGLPGVEVDICRAQLILATNLVPRFTNLTASIQFPLPNATSRVDILDASWAVDGFPLGTVRLAQDVPLFDSSGFSFKMLGAGGSGICTNGTGFTIVMQTNGVPEMTLFGGVGVGLDERSLSWTDGTKITGEACGSVVINGQDLPQLHLDGLAIGGSFRLGGAGGIKLDNASVQVQNLDALFQPTEGHPFQLKLLGTITIPYGPGLILSNAVFKWAGQGLPSFSIKGLTLINPPDILPAPLAMARLKSAGGSGSQTYKYEPVKGLGLDVDAIGIVFLDPNLRPPQLLDPSNIQLTVSAMVQLPPDDPLFFARVDGLTLHWANDEFQASMSGVGLGFDNLEFPPLSLKGIIYVGGINPTNVFESPDLFFAGQVGGKIKDVGAVATLAITPKGILGVCLDVNAGPAGIPLDGGALGGVLLTGASGGVTFTNASDPCDFMSYITIPGGGAPGGGSGAGFAAAPLQALSAKNDLPPPTHLPPVLVTWDDLAAIRRREALDAQLATAPLTSPKSAPVAMAAPMPAGFAGGEANGAADPNAPCVLEPCPPPTISLLCQPHPDQTAYSNHVIIKFTSLTEADLNALGITRDVVNTFGSTADQVGSNVAAVIRIFIDGLLPRAETGGVLSDQQVLEINQGITNVLDDIEAGFAGILRDALQGAMGNQDQIYDAILAAAYAGVPCPSVTVKLTGTLSHAAVSTFLSGTVGAVLSSDGTAGLVGSVNLAGIPVGQMRGFVAVSDARGNPNPSLCGQVEAGLGPLELGVLQALYSCDSCSTGLVAAFVNLGGCLGAQADALIHGIAAKVAPDLNVGAMTSQQILLTLATNTPQMAAFMGELFQQPNLPPGLPQCFIQAMGSAWDSFNPHISVCGQAQPKLFGLPLGSELGSVFMDVTKTNITAQLGFSPSYLIGNTLLCMNSGGTLCGNVFPALDQGTMGFALTIPDAGHFLMAGLSGDLNSAGALNSYLEDNFAYMLQEATFTIGYKLNPFGFEVASANARVIMPELTQHPACQAPGYYVRPEDRGLPSRLELLLWANATNLLGNPAWKGDANTLGWAFPEGDPRRDAVQGFTLTHDYFPYGGVAGAMWLQLPKALVDAPPDVLGQALDPTRPVLERIGATADYIGNYVLVGSEIGSLAFYIPAPNPPCLGGLPTPRELLEAMSQFDPNAVAPPNLYPQGLYPMSEAFLQGYLDGRMLGVPIVQATVELVPPDVNNGTPGYFRGQAIVPPDSWMSNFLDTASATFEIRQSPPLPINVAFSNLLSEVQTAQSQGDTARMNELANGLGGFLTTNLPKVSLQVSVSNLHIPDPLTNLITAGGTANFYAFSPWFDPDYVGVGPVADARRQGGIALQGQMRFADYVTVNDAQLAVYLAEGAPLPALAGLFDVPQLDIPGLPLHEALFQFDSDPAVGEPYLAASGVVDPLEFDDPLTHQPLLTIRNLTNDTARIAADFSLRRAASGPPLPAFAISPSRIDMPMLGPSVEAIIHGATTNDAFSFSSTGPWNASITVRGTICLHDLSGNEVACIGTTNSAFQGSIAGTGFNLSYLAIQTPAGIAMTAFPGTPYEYTVVNDSSASLEIEPGGHIWLEVDMRGTLPLSDLGFGSIASGANLTLTENSLSISGFFNGGALDHVDNLPSARGTMTITRTGVSISGAVSVPAFTMGVFMVSGGNNGPITAHLDNAGLALDSGAKLRLLADGYPNQDLITLHAFTIAANGDFFAYATSGALNIPGYFNLTEGSFRLKRINDVATLDIHSPTLTLFPNASFPSTSITGPFTNVTMSSNGRFYADTGQRTFGLPGAFSATGRLEIGYEPDPRQPGLSVPTSPINFGTVDYGSSATRNLLVRNSGTGLLKATLTSTLPTVFSVTPFDFVVEPGQSQNVVVRFTPDAATARSATLTVLHNAGGASPTISVSGTGRAVPILRPSATSLNFGQVKRGESAQMLLRVDNLGLLTLSGSSTITSGPYTVSPTSFSIAPGGHTLLTVTFTPTAASTQNGNLRLTSNGGSQNVSLSGIGYDSQWYLQREGGQPLNVIAMNSSGRGFAAGENGVLLYTKNNGHSWAPARLFKTPQDLQLFKGHSEGITWRGGAMADDGTHGVIVGPAGKVYLSSNSGESWTQHRNSTATESGWKAATFLPTTARHVLVGSRLREFLPGIWREENVIAVAQNDSGSSYLVHSDLSPLHYNCVAAEYVSGQVVILVGTDGGQVLRSYNAGATWSTITLSAGAGNVTGIALNPNGTALLVTDTGRIYQSTTSGLTWPTVAYDHGDLTGVTFMGNYYAFAVNREGEILRSYSGLGNNFSVWVREEAGLGALNAVAANSSRAWAVGDGARIYHRPGSSLNNGILTFEPASLNFGFVAVGDSSPRVLTFYNRGRSSLTINSLTPTVGGLSGDLVYSPAPPQTIPAGGSLAMNVSFRPTTDRDFTDGELLIFSSDPEGTQVASISGRSASHGWVLKANLPNSAGQTVVDLQMVSDTIGYAITSTRFYKTTDGGTTWTQLSVPTSDPLKSLHFTSTTTGFVAGGSVGKTSHAIILRTTNGGSSWSTVYSSSGNPVSDLHFADATYGYAVKEANGTFYGSVLRTANGGASWYAVNNPSLFDGLAVHAVSSTEVFVASGSRLYRSADSGTTWAQVIYNGSYTIRDVFFSGSSYGYAIGDHGTMWRTLIGGDTSSEWSQVTSFTTEPLNRVCVTSYYDAWATTTASASAGRIYRTRDHGVTWEEELSQSLYAGPANLKPTVVSAASGALPVALGTEGCVRRYEAYLSDPVGIAVAPPVLDFGTAAQGQQVTRTFSLLNAGAKTLLVSNARVNGSEVGNDDFKWTTSLPFSITPGGSRTVSIVAFNRAPGPVSAQLEIVTDGVDPTTTVELRSAVPVPPEVVVFQTSPPGLSLRIDGVTRTAPVAYTIVEGSAGSGEWLAGSSHSIEALDPQTEAGQDFAFNAWDPAENRTFTYTAERRSKTYTAHFVVSQSGSGGGGGGQGFAAMAGNGGGNPPPGVNTGPYIRLTNARLTAPALGNFTATGAALLSVDLIDISLTTTPLILRPNPSTAPVAEITSSAWRFLYSSASNSVQLSAQSPALKLVGNAVTPPSSLDLYFNSAGHFRGNFSLPQGWKVAPGLLEFGPSSLTLAHTNFFYLASSGQARLLRKPDGNWAYTPTLSLEFRDGPFTNTIALPSSIMRLTLPGTTTEFVELHGGAGSKFELRRSASSGNYTALLNNVGLDLMGQSVGAFSGTASTSGQITFSAAPPASPFVLGPFRWYASGTSTLYWNVKNGALSFNLAGGTLKDSGNSVPGWPDGGLSFPGIAFDSQGDFYQKITLPSFTFDGITLGTAADENDRYVVFKRVNGVLSCSLRDQHDFFGSAMSIGFDIDSTGNASGFFKGSFGVDFPDPLGHVDFGSVNLGYNTGCADANYQFCGEATAIGQTFRVRFGSSGARVCHILCAGNNCWEDLCVP